MDGERKRPCSGLVKIVAKQRRAKTQAPALDDTACVSDWTEGFSPADSLMIWFPAHWAAQVIRELESRKQDFRQRFPQWFDKEFPDKYRKQYQDARDSPTLHFQNRQYLKSSIQLLTASVRVTRAGLLRNPARVSCRNVLDIHRRIHRIGRIRSVITRSIRIHSSNESQASVNRTLYGSVINGGRQGCIA